MEIESEKIKSKIKKLSDKTKMLIAGIIFLIGVSAVVFGVPNPIPDGRNATDPVRQDVNIFLTPEDSQTFSEMGITEITYYDNYCSENVCTGIIRTNTGIEIPYSYQIRVFENDGWRRMDDTEIMQSVLVSIGIDLHNIAENFRANQQIAGGREGMVHIQ